MTAPAATWDNVVRGLVDVAFDARGTTALRPAVDEIVSARNRWPLIEYFIAKRAADQELERRTARTRQLVQILRDSYPLPF